jgi:predicted TIM-barrel fold metal-dependent hydrolase
MIGSLEKMRTSIDALDLSDGDREKIRGGNAARILGLS